MKIAIEQAEKEVSEWLDKKKISESKRKSKEDAVEILVNALADGEIIIETTGEITQILKFPTEGEKGEAGVTRLKYKARIKTSTLQVCMQGSKLGDGYGVIISVCSALTNEPKNVIKDLDSEDFSIGQAIANFFL